MLRSFREEEIDILVEIWEKASLVGHPFLSDSFLKEEKWLMKHKFLPGSNTTIFEESGQITGFISTKKNEITGLFVDPGCHRNGIGSKLIEHIKKDTPTLKVEVFENNKIGRSFYTKMGFKEQDQYYHQESKQMMIKMSQISH